MAHGSTVLTRWHLGNDDGDSDTPRAPVKTVDKTSTRTAKRTAEPEAPRSQAAGPRRGGFSGSEAGESLHHPIHFHLPTSTLTSIAPFQPSVTATPALIATAERPLTMALVVVPEEVMAPASEAVS